MFEPTGINSTEDLSSCAKNEMLDWVRSVELKGTGWVDFRRLFKLAETTTDPRLISEFLIRIDSEPLPRTGTPSAATIGYFKRRGRRFLRRLATTNSVAYAELGLQILSHSGLRSNSLPDYCWLAYDLLYGRRAASSGRTALSESSPLQENRIRATQTRHGRGRYRITSYRPTVNRRQDALPEHFPDDMESFRTIAENADLPWQTLEAAAIRMALADQTPAPSASLYRSFLGSPSPLLHQLAAHALATGKVCWAEIRPDLVAKCCLVAAAPTRRDLVREIALLKVPCQWRADFVVAMLASLKNDRNSVQRDAVALESLLAITADTPDLLDSGALVHTLERSRDTRGWIAAVSRVFAKRHASLPDSSEFFSPFISSPTSWLRCIGWWLIAKRLPSPAARGELWAAFIAGDESRVEPTLADPVAISTVQNSVAARQAVLSFLEDRPQTIVRILRSAQSPSRQLALRALSHPPRNARQVLDQFWELHEDNRERAAYAILDGVSTKKHYAAILESFATSHNDELRGLFWEWCCQSSNREWLHERLPELVSHVTEWSARTFETRGNVALSLAAAGVFDLRISWSSSITKGLKVAAKTGNATELSRLLEHVPDKHWASCERAVARRLSSDKGLNDTFWALFFRQLQAQHKGLERIVRSDLLKETVATVVRPGFLGCDAESATLLIDHWIAANPTALDDMTVVLELAANRDARIRRHAIQRLRDLTLDLPIALRLIETGLPDARDLGTEAVETKWQTVADRQTIVLELVDSPNPVARQLGWTLFKRLNEAGEAGTLVPRLAENEDEHIAAGLLELFATNPVHAGAVAAIQERVLLTPTTGRAVKEAVKRQLSCSSPSHGSDLLLRVAHGAAKRDREWAIEQLVAMRLAGHTADGVDVVTEGFV